jgi:hypothetical protein
LWQGRIRFGERSGRVFRDPITQFQIFLNFAAFVSVLFRFVWPVIDLSEGVFGVADCVGDYVEGFCHGSDPLLRFLRSAFSEKSANPPGKSPCCRFNDAIAVREVVTT